MNVFLPADILIPDVESMEKWSVIACDQFSSQPEYWKDVKETVGDAPVELPHVLLLCDDRSDGLMKWLSGKKKEMRKIYNFNLMKEGGHISGWLVSGKLAKDFEKKITSYENINAEMPYAVGDGNHSLATAKVCYENYKMQMLRQDMRWWSWKIFTTKRWNFLRFIELLQRQMKKHYWMSFKKHVAPRMDIQYNGIRKSAKVFFI